MALVHKHIIIRAEVLNPPKAEYETCDKVKNLIEQIGMKILMGPFAKYCEMKGNRGLTVATIIETSHIVMHSWDETVPANIQLDVYTCGEFKPETVFNWLQQFNPTKIDYKYLDREHGLIEIPIDDPSSKTFTTEELVEATKSIYPEIWK
jgi:S-adenosylmethionine/arginine decarboxylase-like enzyme